MDYWHIECKNGDSIKVPIEEKDVQAGGAIEAFVLDLDHCPTMEDLVELGYDVGDEVEVTCEFDPEVAACLEALITYNKISTSGNHPTKKEFWGASEEETKGTHKEEGC